MTNVQAITILIIGHDRFYDERKGIQSHDIMAEGDEDEDEDKKEEELEDEVEEESEVKEEVE